MRGAAKRTLEASHDAIDREMREVERDFAGVKIRGIVGNTERTPLDECGHVYKDLDEVLAVLESEGIARSRIACTRSPTSKGRTDRFEQRTKESRRAEALTPGRTPLTSRAVAVTRIVAPSPLTRKRRHRTRHIRTRGVTMTP